MAKLNVIEGPDIGSEFDLPEAATEGTLLTVGRDTAVDLTLSDPAVSREHFRLEASHGRWRLVDLGSRNRTFLNGAPVGERLLEPGDLVRIGDTEMRYEGERATAADPQSTIIKTVHLSGPSETFIERIDQLERTIREEKARRALDEVKRLVELQSSMATATNPSDFLDRLLVELAPAIAAQRTSLLAREADVWSVCASQPEAAEGDGLVQAVVERAAENREGVLIENPAGDAAIAEGGAVDNNISAVLALPVCVGENVCAIVYAEWHGGDSYDKLDVEWLGGILAAAAPTLARLLESERLRSENDTLFRQVTSGKKLIGRSAAIEQTLHLIERAAPTPMTVLVFGETGTGKELVASAIHYSSPRRGRPFVAINCAALPENLVESELFGHEKGAFTGAAARRKGRFEQAHTGTIFLDEVGELSLPCQAKLLRLLEERRFERVGGSESIEVDVRVIAATNRDLPAAVEEGTFREDLFYRLSVINIELPPLRERTGDIPLLARHFVEERCGQAKQLSKAAEKKLTKYAWPGNIRQLRNVIESALALGDGDEISADDVVLPTSAPRRGGQGGGTWQPISLQALERDHIARVLEHTGGNKKRAAEILGIERCTLYAKIKAHDLATP